MENPIIISGEARTFDVLKTVLKLAYPVILSNLLYTIESAFSIILVSGISSTAVAAVGYSASMLWFIYSLMALSYTGTSVLVAQRKGARKDPSPAFVWGLLISFLIALPLTFWGTDLVAMLMLSFGASDQVVSLAKKYLDPIFMFITVGFITNTVYAAYNGYGDTKTPFKVALLMNITNILTAYLLIYGRFGMPALGVYGAGLGVAISEVVGLLVYVILYLFYRKPFEVSFRFDLSELKEFLRIGTPTAFERGITSLSFNIFVGFLASFGDKVLAAHQVGLRVESVSFMIGFGFMVASTVISGQNWGAGNYQGLDKAVSVIAHTTAFTMGLLALPMLMFPSYLSMIFTKDPEVIKYASYYLMLVALSQPQMAYASIYSGALKGMGKTALTMWINILSFWLFRIVPSYLLLPVFKSPLVPWIFMSVEMTLRSLLFHSVYKRVMKAYL